jgi:hypothetical protein
LTPSWAVGRGELSRATARLPPSRPLGTRNSEPGTRHGEQANPEAYSPCCSCYTSTAAAPERRVRRDAIQLGISTLSITWITPLLARMSALTTVALLSFTLPLAALIFTSCPFTVFAEGSLDTS